VPHCAGSGLTGQCKVRAINFQYPAKSDPSV